MTKKKVIKNSIIYTVNDILIKAFNFLLLPLYTAYLTTNDYGTTNLIASFTGVSGFVVACSLYAAIIRFYSEVKDDREQVKRLFGTIILFVFFSGLLFSALISIFHGVFIPLLFRGLNFYPTILVSLLGLIFGCLYTVYQHILKGMENAKKFSFVCIANFLLNLGLNIIFVVVMRKGADGVLLSLLISNIIVAGYMIIDLKKNDLIAFCIDRKLLKELLKYSVPLLPHNLSTNITNLVSRIFINNSFSLVSVGLFALASQFGTVADTIQSSVNKAFQPWFYDQMNKKERNYKKEIVQLSDIFIWIYGAIFLLISLFSQELILLFTNENYYKAWTVVPFIVITYSIKTMYYFYINILFYYKKATKFIFLATISGSIINIFLSALLIPRMDMYGSVLADAIAMVFRVGIIAALSKHFDDIGYKINKFILLTVIDISFIGIGLIFSYTKYLYQFSWMNIGYKVIILLLYLSLAAFALRKNIRPFMEKLKNIRSTRLMNLRKTIRNHGMLHRMARKTLNLNEKLMMFLCNKLHGNKNDKIVFSSFDGKSYSDNPKAVSEKLHELYPQADIVWLFRQPEQKKDIVPDYVRCVKTGSGAALKELATARVWVDNAKKHIGTYKSKNQVYIQTWHGDRGFKKVLHDCYEKFDRNRYVEAKICDIITVGSKFGKEQLTSAFRYSGAFLQYGSPRNDLLCGKDEHRADAIKASLGISEKSKIFMYAPTFRDITNQIQEMQGLDLIEITKTLREKTKDDWICLIRAHSHSKGLACDAELAKAVMDVTEYEDMAELLLITDLLITDYSSSAGDFPLLDRPVILFQDDREKYIKYDRNFYFEIDESPFIVAKNQQELIQIIQELDWSTIPQNCKDILDFYGTTETGKASEKVAEYIIEKIRRA